MRKEIYEEIRGVSSCGWFDATMRVLRRHYPGRTEKELSDAARQCNVHPPVGKECGYQGSLSPIDCDRLFALLEAAK